MAAIVIVVILIVLLVARDGAARRRERRLLNELSTLREQLKHSERLVNVGQLVSGLAQDLKSPLQGMLGSAELLETSGSTGDHAAQVQDIRDNVTRAVGIVRNLLAFTETTTLDRRWHDLNDIVRGAVEEHDSKTKASEDGVAFHGTSLQLVYVDGRQLEKVILTLLARTASGSRGLNRGVVVATHRVALPTDHIVIDIDDPAVSGADDDVAWSGDVDACRRVLQAHGGSLEMEYQASGGLRFHMELPVTELVENQGT